MWQKKEDEFHQVHSTSHISLLLPLCVSLTPMIASAISRSIFFFFFYAYQQSRFMMLISPASLLFIDVIVCHWRSIDIRKCLPSLKLPRSLPTVRMPVVQSTSLCGAVESSVIGMLGRWGSLHFKTPDTWVCVFLCYKWKWCVWKY